MIRDDQRQPSHQVSFVSPNLNAYLKRFIQTIQHECLDQFVVLGERHLDHLVREFVEHYHTERPHQALENRTIAGPPPPLPLGPGGGIQRQTRLGGMLKHYYRVTA